MLLQFLFFPVLYQNVICEGFVIIHERERYAVNDRRGLGRIRVVTRAGVPVVSTEGAA